MQTRNFIKDTTQILRVVELGEGDVYKRLIPKSAYREAKLRFGIVTSTLNNGEHTVLTAIEVRNEDESHLPPVGTEVFDTEADLILFPATRDEVKIELERAVGTSDQRIRTAREELERKKSQHELLISTVEKMQEPSQNAISEVIAEQINATGGVTIEGPKEA